AARAKPGRFPDASGISAMWAFRTHLHALVLAMRTSDQIALWAGQDIDDQPDNPGEKYQKHPQHGTIHSAVLGVFCDPNQQGNVQGNDADNDEAENAHAAARGQTTSGIIVVKN